MYCPQKSKAVTIIGILGIAIGVMVVAGWIFDLPGLENIFPKYVSMRFNTALCLILLGTALLLTQFQVNKNQALFTCLSVALTFIGALSLAQDVFHFNAGIDQLFVADKLSIAEKYPFPGRMAANVSACFLLFGLAFIGFSTKTRFVHILSQYLLHLVTAISAVAILGYLFGLSLFYNLSYVGSMAVHTAILFFLMSTIASLLHPELGIANLFTGQLVGNRMARRIFTLIVFMVLIFGSLRLQSQRFEIFSFEVGISLLALSFLLVSLGITWSTAIWLNKNDLKRYEAEDQVKLMNLELEERVDRRSAELLKLLEKYRESESKFKAAFEFSAIGMALVSLDGYWIKVNKRLCEMVGYTEEELLNMSFMDITHPDDIGDGIILMEKAAKNGSRPYRIEKRYLHKNGASIWASVNMATVTDDNGVPLYLVSQIEDITERKKTGARFKAIVESVFVGINLNDANWNIIYRSPSMQAFNGWTDEEMDKNYLSLVHPDDLKEVEKVRSEVLLNPGKSINLVYRILTTKGNYIWIESLVCNKLSDPDIAAIMTVTRDITERKIVEDQLKKSEEKYHSFIEHASDAIYLLDLEGNFTDANESMCKMTGYTKDELLKLNIEQLIDPEQLKIDPVTHGRRSGDHPVIRERRLVHKNGEILDVEINVKMFPDDKVLVIARDICDRKRMEEDLRQAELKFRIMAEKSMVGVYISQRQRFTYVNPRFAEIFGYEPHELINTTESAVKIIIADEDQETVWKNIQARYSGEADNAHYEIRGKKKDGTHNYVEFYGSRVIIDGEPSIIGTMMDITERKRSEELILREKTLSESLINSLPEVFYLRNAKGEFLRWNKNFEKVTGYTPEEIKNSNARLLIVEEDRESVRQAVEKIAGGGHATVEARVITTGDIKVPFLITITSLLYEGQPCVLGIAIDISSRIKAEEELRSSEHKYKLLFESNPQPLSMIAKDDLSIIAINEAATTLYGYTKDELLNMNAAIFRPREDREQQLEIFRKDMSSTTDIGVIRHVKKDGSLMFVHVIAHDIIFEGRSVRLSLTTDITEKLKAEDELQKSQANLKAIMDTTDTAYALLDKKLRIIAYNHMAVKFGISQYDHVPAQGDQLTDFLQKRRLPHFVKNADEVLKGKNMSYEINYPQPDGSTYWYDVKLFPIANDKQEILGLMMSLLDITERKNAEENLKAAYNLIQDHISSIKDMAWKQSHLIRSPVANLKGLAALLNEDPADSAILEFINLELDRLDAVIIEMAEDASNHDI